MWAGVSAYRRQATDAEVVAASDVLAFVAPDQIRRHPLVDKFYVRFDGTGTVAIAESSGVSSITDNGTGDYTVNLADAFDGTTWAPFASTSVDGVETVPRMAAIKALTASSVRIVTGTNAALEDRAIVTVSGKGTLA